MIGCSASPGRTGIFHFTLFGPSRPGPRRTLTDRTSHRSKGRINELILCEEHHWNGNKLLKKKKKAEGKNVRCVYSWGEAQSEVRQLYVENVIHWQVSVKGVYRRAIEQLLLQVASLRSDAETRVTAGLSFAQTYFPKCPPDTIVSWLSVTNFYDYFLLCISSVYWNFLLRLISVFNTFLVRHLVHFSLCMNCVFITFPQSIMRWLIRNFLLQHTKLSIKRTTFVIFHINRLHWLHQHCVNTAWNMFWN